jgi:serine/threonine-protein kinase HipA
MLHVFLYDRLAGSIGFWSSKVTVFTFDEAYLADPDRPTLSQSMLDPAGEPRAPKRSELARLPAFFSNLLPEGRLRAYLAEQAATDERDEPALLAALGDDLPGALTVRRNADEARPLPARTLPDVDQPMRFSLAGVQLKFSAFGNDDSKGLTIPVRGVGGNWIVKLPSRRFDKLPEAECATMTFAKAIGIDVPEHRILPVASIAGLPKGVDDFGTAYAIKRYDRAAGGGLIHQEDFAQVLAAYPNKKYHAPNMGPIAQIVAEACGSEDAQEFVRRLVFNIAIGNGDMHLKNVSLYYPDGRTARLSPAYDFVPTARYVTGDGFAIPIVRTKRFEAITEDEFAEFADGARLSRRQTIATVRDTVARLRSAWPSARDTVGFDQESRVLIDRHLERVPLLGGTPTPRPRPPRARRSTASAPRWTISVSSHETNVPVSGAAVAAVADNGTVVSGRTDQAGNVRLEAVAGHEYTLLVGHPGHRGEIIRSYDGTGPVRIFATADARLEGSVIGLDGTAHIPGLNGRLNPILDSLLRRYLYADNISINDQSTQPVNFTINEPITLQDAHGARFEVFVRYIHGRAFLMDYRRLERLRGRPSEVRG